MSARELALKMLRYKAWASEISYATAATLPDEELTRVRSTNFGTIAFTLNHLYVVDDIFKAHLTGVPHAYTARNTPTHPPLSALWASVRALDRWYLEYASSLSEEDLHARVRFQFVGGGEGSMTRLEIFLHLVNHTTYHRGFVADMLNQCGVFPRATDLSVFLRDAWPQEPR